MNINKMSIEIRIDKISSAAAMAVTVKSIFITKDRFSALSGDVIAARALTENPTYGNLELPGGRLARIRKDDVILGVLGRRQALKGFVGDVPDEIGAGDHIHLLNMGGILGRALGQHSSLSDAIELEVLGSAVANNGKIINISDFAMPPAEKLHLSVPVILVTGTCMNSGKTEAAIELIKTATRRGIAPGGAKLSGIACLRDTLNMQDHGAIATSSFLDCGVPSTAGAEGLADVARAVLNRVASFGPDIIVAELGDGIVGGYSVEQILSDGEIMSAVSSIVFCASDYVGVIGGQAVLARYGLKPDVISGPVTDSKMGEDFITKNIGLPAANGRRNPDKLFELAFNRLAGKQIIESSIA